MMHEHNFEIVDNQTYSDVANSNVQNKIYSKLGYLIVQLPCIFVRLAQIFDNGPVTHCSPRLWI